MPFDSLTLSWLRVNANENRLCFIGLSIQDYVSLDVGVHHQSYELFLDSVQY